MSDPPKTKTLVGKIEPLQRPASVETIHIEEGTCSLSDNQKPGQRSSPNRIAFKLGDLQMLLEGTKEFLFGALNRMAFTVLLAILGLLFFIPELAAFVLP